MSDHDQTGPNHTHPHTSSDGGVDSDTMTVPPATVVNNGTVDARITGITDEAAEALRHHVEAASGGGNRFLWFIGGFVAALVAGAVAAVLFLVISDQDDDGNLQIEVPAVELDVEP
jgi:hypothetical protein